MLKRGFRLLLEPDLYETHAALAARLRRSRAWEEREPKPIEPVADESRKGPEEPTLLPHQMKVVEEIRRNNSFEYGESQ